MTAITWAPVMQMVLKSESDAQIVIKCKNLTHSILGVVSIYKGYYAYWSIKWSIHVAFRSITNIFNIFFCVNHSKLSQVHYIYLPCFVNKASKLSNLHHSASSVIIFSFCAILKYKLLSSACTVQIYDITPRLNSSISECILAASKGFKLH